MSAVAKEKAAVVNAAADGTQVTVARGDQSAIVSAKEKASTVNAAAEGTQLTVARED